MDVQDVTFYADGIIRCKKRSLMTWKLCESHFFHEMFHCCFQFADKIRSVNQSQVFILGTPLDRIQAAPIPLCGCAHVADSLYSEVALEVQKLEHRFAQKEQFMRVMLMQDTLQILVQINRAHIKSIFSICADLELGRDVGSACGIKNISKSVVSQ